MKTLILLLFPIAFLASCNTEIPEDQFREQLNAQCKKQMVEKFVADATEEQQDDFCNCYADYFIDNNESLTMKTVIATTKDQEKLEAAINSCIDQALED